jgi:catechol-2,3-dioxygenase
MIIKELTLLTNNLAATEEFYTKILELPLLAKSATNISFSAGHSTLSFSLVADKDPCYHFAFSIPSNKVNEALSYIAQRTRILPYSDESTIADFTNWNAHAFYFHDNQKNILEFIAHHDLATTSNKPFTSSSITGICEIGVPVEDVTEACKTINEKFGVPYFKKGPRLHHFSVMGDEYGLFIVTKSGRGWVPTQQPAERHFAEVVFANENSEGKYVIQAH